MQSCTMYMLTNLIYFQFEAFVLMTLYTCNLLVLFTILVVFAKIICCGVPFGRTQVFKIAFCICVRSNQIVYVIFRLIIPQWKLTQNVATDLSLTSGDFVSGLPNVRQR